MGLQIDGLDKPMIKLRNILNENQLVDNFVIINTGLPSKQFTGGDKFGEGTEVPTKIYNSLKQVKRIAVTHNNIKSKVLSANSWDELPYEVSVLVYDLKLKKNDVNDLKKLKNFVKKFNYEIHQLGLSKKVLSL